MVVAIRIEPNQYYDQAGVCETLDIATQSLQKECREGRLRYVKRGGKRFFRGQWLIDWLDGSEAADDE
jgi:hypothetical protein